MGLLMLEHFQNIPDFCVLIDKQRLRHNLRNGLIRHLAVDIEVLLKLPCAQAGQLEYS
jgi:hypothetical protein